MLNETMTKQFIRSVPWGSVPMPMVQFAIHECGAPGVLLYSLRKRLHVTCFAHTFEAALRQALLSWAEDTMKGDELAAVEKQLAKLAN